MANAPPIIVRTEPSSPSEHSWVAWLLDYAEKEGDRLPFGDGEEHQLRLPFYSKKAIWELYVMIDYIKTRMQKTSHAAIWMRKGHWLCGRGLASCAM